MRVFWGYDHEQADYSCSRRFARGRAGGRWHEGNFVSKDDGILNQVREWTERLVVEEVNGDAWLMDRIGQGQKIAALDDVHSQLPSSPSS